MSTTYEVATHREGKWWVFEIPALDTTGQARSLDEVEREARGIISAWDAEPVPAESITINVAVRGVEDVMREWAAADADTAAAESAYAKAAERRRGAVARLRNAGYTQTDVARVFGVSKQRVSQLAKH